MSQISILHISDLHRERTSPIRNDALLNSLENDRERYSTTDDPMVRSPDIIVASGDIIYGVAPGTKDAAAKLEEQYREALDFLNDFAKRCVGGDKQRVVIVPDNHDVSACHFMESVAGRKCRKRDAGYY